MKNREFNISKRADEFIRSLPDGVRTRIKADVLRLMVGDVQGLDIRKLEPHPHDFRLRVGRIRILFTSDANRLFIFKVGFRGDVHK